MSVGGHRALAEARETARIHHAELVDAMRAAIAERDEARETARTMAEAVDDDCKMDGRGRYSRWFLEALDRALAYPRRGG